MKYTINFTNEANNDEKLGNFWAEIETCYFHNLKYKKEINPDVIWDNQFKEKYFREMVFKHAKAVVYPNWKCVKYKIKVKLQIPLEWVPIQMIPI